MCVVDNYTILQVIHFTITKSSITFFIMSIRKCQNTSKPIVFMSISKTNTLYKCVFKGISVINFREPANFYLYYLYYLCKISSNISAVGCAWLCKRTTRNNRIWYKIRICMYMYDIVTSGKCRNFIKIEVCHLMIVNNNKTKVVHFCSHTRYHVMCIFTHQI